MMNYAELGAWLQAKAPKGAKVREIDYGYHVSETTVRHICGRVARYGYEICGGDGVWFRRTQVDGKFTWMTSSYS